MRSIFLRIYIGILCAVILIGSGVLVTYRYWNEDRLSEYLTTTSYGMLKLIAEGLERHQGERREQWLALSRRVTSLQIEMVGLSEVPADTNTVTLQSSNNTPSLLLRTVDNSRRELYLRLRQTNNTNKARWMRVPLKEADINEQLMRGTQLLLLNELGRYPKAERKSALQRLQAQFSYPLQWLSRAEINANYLQQRALARGDTVVDLQTTDGGQRAIRTLAPIGNSGDYLQLGPVPLFDSFPRALIMVVGLLALALLAITCFLLVKPLERRLGRMAQEVDGLQLSGNSDPLTVDGNDALTALAEKINAMSSRIRQLLVAQRELNRAVSHELKTPLARLKFRRELALQKLEQLAHNGSDIAPVIQHLDGMETSLTELNCLVEEILLYASLESAAPELNPTKVPLAAVLNELMEPIRSQFPDLQLSHNAPTNLTLYADAHYLKRALQNLLGNAQRYASEQVEVSIDVQSGLISINVEDDGPGIPEDKWQQVLEPFSRVEASRNRQTGGSGLGLAIVRQIAHWHEGEISIGHARLGGTRACLTLPFLSDAVGSEQRSGDSVTN